MIPRAHSFEQRHHLGGAGGGFTLIEVLLAMTASAIVLAAMGSVFFSALRLRERTSAALDATAKVQPALALLRQDLQNAMSPGVLVGNFRCGVLPVITGESLGLQFSTSGGVIRDGELGGDVEEVTYELRDPVQRTEGGGKELVRSVNRNMLATLMPEMQERFLLGNVEKFQVTCYDGQEWRDTWDTSLTETNLPVAVRVQLQFVVEPGTDAREVAPIELLVPLMGQARTNQVDEATGETQ